MNLKGGRGGGGGCSVKVGGDGAYFISKRDVSQKVFIWFIFFLLQNNNTAAAATTLFLDAKHSQRVFGKWYKLTSESGVLLAAKHQMRRHRTRMFVSRKFIFVVGCNYSPPKSEKNPKKKIKK